LLNKRVSTKGPLKLPKWAAAHCPNHIVDRRVAADNGQRIFSENGEAAGINGARARAMKTRLTMLGTVLAVGFAGLCGDTAEAAKREGGGYPALVAAQFNDSGISRKRPNQGARDKLHDYRQ